MSTHAAIAITSVGKIGQVQVATPAPERDELLVEMKYAAFMAVDTYQTDYGFLLDKSSYPHVLGFAGSGFVKSVGEGVVDFKEGDKVRPRH